MLAVITKDTFEKLPEAMQAEYVLQNDGDFKDKYLLKFEAGDSGLSMENISGLRTALNSERTLRKTAEKNFEPFKDMDAGAAQSALDQIAKLGDKADIKSQVDAAVQTRQEQLVAQHNQALADEKKRGDALAKLLGTTLKNDRVTQAIVAEGGDPELLGPHILPMVRAHEESPGEFKVEVLDDKGNLDVDGSGNGVTIPQLVTKFKQNERFGFAFKGTESSGSGAGKDGTGKGQSTTQRDGEPIRIRESDREGIQANLEGIAKGTHVVVGDDAA